MHRHPNAFSSGMALSVLIGAVVFFVIASALMPSIGDTTAEATCSWTTNTSLCATNVTGASATIVNLYPLFFAIIGLAGAAAIIALVMGKV